MLEKSTEGIINPENLSRYSAIALLIDNENFEYAGWDNALSPLGIKTIRIGTPQACTDFNALVPEVASKVHLVVADQFYGNMTASASIRWPAYKLLRDIRRANKECWIVETSHSPVPTRYPGITTNVTIHTASDTDLMQAEISRVYKLMPHESLSKIISFACNVDTLLAGQTENEGTSIEYLFERLLERYANLNKILAILGLDKQEFTDKFNTLLEPKQRDLLHCSFQIFGHFNAGRDDTYYSGPLTRLKMLLSS